MNDIETLSREGQESGFSAASDAALVARSQAGEDAAFEELVRRYQGAAYNLALSLLSVPEDARDASAEGFFRAWRSLARLRRDDGFKPWLMTIVANRSRSMLRRRYIQRRALFWRRPEGLDTPRGDWGEADGPSPGSAEARDIIRAGLLLLTPRERDVFSRKYQEGKTINDIAADLEIAPGTVKSLLFRATHKILKRIKEHSR